MAPLITRPAPALEEDAVFGKLGKFTSTVPPPVTVRRFAPRVRSELTPLKVRVRYEVNKAAFDEAMTKLEKSMLMNSSNWGKITFLATPDLIMKRDNQSTISEEIGKDSVFVLGDIGPPVLNPLEKTKNAF